MKKRIYLNMVLLTSLAVILSYFLLSFVFYNQFYSQIKDDLKERIESFTNYNIPTAIKKIKDIDMKNTRITIISSDGTVKFDNISDISNLENHLEREEVQEAILYGYGESSRYSTTVEQKTFYIAMQLKDDGIIRFGKTTQSIWGLFASIIPTLSTIIAIVIILSYLAAGRLTKRIIDPINNVNLSGKINVPYDELSPFIRTIVNQQNKIKDDFILLQKNSNTINTITENMNEGLIIIDTLGNILSINDSANKIFELKPSIELGNILELIRDMSLIESMKKAMSGISENMIFTINGKIYNILISPIAEIGFILFLLDITEKSLSEKRRREFSANVSHELKTPLTSIYGNIELLHKGLVKDEDKNLFYTRIMDETSRLIALIEDIIKISQLDEFKLEDFQLIKLSQIAEECKKSLSQKAKNSSINISIIGEGIISGNYTMIYEMLYNLIDNSIKYNKFGGSISIELYETDKQVTLYVIDTGIGISSIDKENVFQRFYTVDKSRYKKIGGTGLGLAIVKHIVLAHNGTVEILDNEGNGTKIKIIFNK